MRQSIRAARGPICARVALPGSKSITNRAFLLAALAQGKSTLSNVLLSDDTEVFAQALRQVGVSIQIDKATCVAEVIGVNGNFPQREATLWCGDAGTAARFLLAACAAVGGIYQFDASARLRLRPMSPLLDCLRMQGVKVSAPSMPLTIASKGGLPGGTISIAGAQSSQFASGVLMAAPFFKHPLSLTVINPVSKPYLAMTSVMMQEFGAQIAVTNDQLTVATSVRYQGRDYFIEPDMSTASYFFAAAAVTAGTLTIPALDAQQTLQGDSKFLDVLIQMGCLVSKSASQWHIQGPRQLRGVNIDMNDFSDTFMTLAALACFADTPTTITNIGHTRLQESDRISAMATNLQTLGIKIEEGRDWLKIFPGEPHGANIDSFGDHRIAMSSAILGLRTDGIVIDNAGCVSKTCPDFFRLWEELS